MASEAVRLQRISYGSGGSGIIGLLDAQRQYQQAKLGYVRAQAQALPGYDPASGGDGWRLVGPNARIRGRR